MTKPIDFSETALGTIMELQADIKALAKTMKEDNADKKAFMLKRTAYAVVVLLQLNKVKDGAQWKENLKTATSKSTGEKTITFGNHVKRLNPDLTVSYDGKGVQAVQDWMKEKGIDSWSKIENYGVKEKKLSKLGEKILTDFSDQLVEGDYQGYLVVDELESFQADLRKVLLRCESKVDTTSAEAVGIA